MAFSHLSIQPTLLRTCASDLKSEVDKKEEWVIQRVYPAALLKQKMLLGFWLEGESY